MALATASTGEVDRATEGRIFTVAPSDLTFLLSECLRCFYLKVSRKVRRPPSPFPGVFTAMDRQQRKFFHGEPTRALEVSLPPGRLDCSDTRIVSQPLVTTAAGTGIAIGGTLDALAEFSNGDSGVIDFKTVTSTDPGLDKYGLQLHGYALALERPAQGPSRRVATLGLMCFMPEEMILLPDGRVAFAAARKWIPFERNDAEFLVLLKMLCQILEHPQEPKASTRCHYCKLR